MFIRPKQLQKWNTLPISDSGICLEGEKNNQNSLHGPGHLQLSPGCICWVSRLIQGPRPEDLLPRTTMVPVTLTGFPQRDLEWTHIAVWTCACACLCTHTLCSLWWLWNGLLHVQTKFCSHHFCLWIYLSCFHFFTLISTASVNNLITSPFGSLYLFFLVCTVVLGLLNGWADNLK